MTSTPPPVPGSPAQAPPRTGTKTDGMAIASLVLGLILCLGALTGIPAMILGFLSHGRINKSEGRLGGKGMAIAGIVLGTVGILVTVGQIVIVLPAISAARTSAMELRSKSNLRSIGAAAAAYAADNKGELPVSFAQLADAGYLAAPTTVTPDGEIQIDYTRASIFVHPAHPGQPGYEIVIQPPAGETHANIMGLSAPPSDVILAQERQPTRTGGPRFAVFVDGHVEEVPSNYQQPSW